MFTVRDQSNFAYQRQYTCDLTQDTVLVHHRRAWFQTIRHTLVDDEFAGVRVGRVIQDLCHHTHGVETFLQIQQGSELLVF